MFDRKGYCIRHPHVRLRKKKMLGGWQIIIANCPHCCAEEMSRLKMMEKSKRKEKKSKKKKKKEVAVPNLDDGEEEASQGRSQGGLETKLPESPQERMGADQSMPSTRQRSKSRDRTHRPYPQSNRSVPSTRQRSKSRDRKHQLYQNHSGKRDQDAPIFEFDIPLDERGEVVASSKSVAGKSVKTSKSQRSGRSKKSAKSTRTNKSGKSARTNKSAKTTRTNKSGKSLRTSRSKSKSRSDVTMRSKSRSRSDATMVSRGTTAGSSQRFVHKPNGQVLRVAKMPFTDRYNREGKYTGEIDDVGQPHGRGTLRYNNGTVFEGDWVKGCSDEMDQNMSRATSGGFRGDWKARTSRKERENEKEGFNSQSMHSGSAEMGRWPSMRSLRSEHGDAESRYSGNSAGGSHSQDRKSPLQQNQARLSPPQEHRHCPPPQQIHRKEEVVDMPWSDLNGFDGHYSGQVTDDIPDGHGVMRYSNGVMEEGMFCMGVFQPPSNAPPEYPPSANAEGGNMAVPSSSMSVWSLKSSPTMAFQQGGHNVLHGGPLGSGAAGSSVMGAPANVHLGDPGGLYHNLNR